VPATRKGIGPNGLPESEVVAYGDAPTGMIQETGGDCAHAASGGRVQDPIPRHHEPWGDINKKKTKTKKKQQTQKTPLRTPINAIIGFSEMTRKGRRVMVDARRTEYAQMINARVSLCVVVNGIRDMSRWNPPNRDFDGNRSARGRALLNLQPLALKARDKRHRSCQQRAEISSGNDRRSQRSRDSC